jgi:hypothetical protein
VERRDRLETVILGSTGARQSQGQLSLGLSQTPLPLVGRVLAESRHRNLLLRSRRRPPSPNHHQIQVPQCHSPLGQRSRFGRNTSPLAASPPFFDAFPSRGRVPTVPCLVDHGARKIAEKSEREAADVPRHDSPWGRALCATRHTRERERSITPSRGATQPNDSAGSCAATARSSPYRKFLRPPVV